MNKIEKDKQCKNKKSHLKGKIKMQFKVVVLTNYY